MKRTASAPRQLACSFRSAGLMALGTLALVAACSSDSGGGLDGETPPPPKPDAVTVCETSCGETHAAGKDDYLAYRECLLCDACAHACGAKSGCAEPVENAPCASTGDDCTACVSSACAGAQATDTTFEGHCAAQGSACIGNAACVAMNNCVSNCINNPGSGSGGSGGGGGAGGAG